MKGYAMLARSPLEVGDTVMLKGWDYPVEVTEIETVHSARTGATVMRHYFDGWLMPLEAVDCRLVGDERVPIADGFTVTEKVVDS